MQSSGGIIGMRKHRQGGNGKNAGPNLHHFTGKKAGKRVRRKSHKKRKKIRF